MRHNSKLLTALLALAYTSTFAQQTRCFSAEEIAAQRSKGEAEVADYQGTLKELRNVYEQYQQSLSSLASCQKDRTLLDDLTRTLLFQNAECRAETETSETLKARTTAVTGLLQSKQLMLSLLAANYKAAIAARCQ